MRKPRPYFLLVARADKLSPWGIEFGDYDRETVDAEREDYRDHDWAAGNLRVLRVADDGQHTCNDAVAGLNERVAA